MASTKTILFIGATGGCGLAALRKSLAAGHTCVAICRIPSKLGRLLLPLSAVDTAEDDLMNRVKQQFPNLYIESGNARDAATVARCLISPANSLPVDVVISGIGHAPTLGNKDDWHVCEYGIYALMDAIREVRMKHASWTPQVIAISTTGISDHGRDVPLLFAPLYYLLLRSPHEDKKIMERSLVQAAKDGIVHSTIIRASLLTNGVESTYPIRVGVEDSIAGKCESSAVGYTISRNDVGKWLFENIIQGTNDKWFGKVATITY